MEALKIVYIIALSLNLLLRIAFIDKEREPISRPEAILWLFLDWGLIYLLLT